MLMRIRRKTSFTHTLSNSKGQTRDYIRFCWAPLIPAPFCTRLFHFVSTNQSSSICCSFQNSVFKATHELSKYKMHTFALILVKTRELLIFCGLFPQEWTSGNPLGTGVYSYQIFCGFRGQVSTSICQERHHYRWSCLKVGRLTG